MVESCLGGGEGFGPCGCSTGQSCLQCCTVHWRLWGDLSAPGSQHRGQGRDCGRLWLRPQPLLVLSLQSLDLAEYSVLFVLSFTTPAFDSDVAPSFGTLLATVNVALNMLGEVVPIAVGEPGSDPRAPLQLLL